MQTARFFALSVSVLFPNSFYEIMRGTDDRLLVVAWPCSIHDPAAAIEYAQRMKAVREQQADKPCGDVPLKR